jgi:hypothetical protein
MVSGFYFNGFNSPASLPCVPIISYGINSSEGTPRLSFFRSGRIDKPEPSKSAVRHEPTLILTTNVPRYIDVSGIPVQARLTNIYSKKVGDRISLIVCSNSGGKF